MAGSLLVMFNTQYERDEVLQDKLIVAEGPRFIKELQHYLQRIQGTWQPAFMRAAVCDDFASQSVNCDQSDAVEGTDSITIGHVTLSVEAVPADENEFLLGADDAAFADNLAAAINAHSVLKQFVRATSDGVSDVTVYCLWPGEVGNAIALAEVGNGFTLGGAALAGGTGNDPASYEFKFAGD